MSIAVAHPSSAAKPSVSVPGRRYDHLFFSALALLLLATVFVGFARSYYLAGVFRAPLPTRIVHLHGAAFSCWILLLVVQPRWSLPIVWASIAGSASLDSCKPFLW